MKVRDLYEPGIMAAQADETLKIAAARMREHAIGALAVYEGQRLAGIITERDLARAIADGGDPATNSVRDYMTIGAVSVSPDAEASSAAGMLLLLGARHLPVIEDGRVIGMLSARDLMLALTSATVGVPWF